MDSKHFKMPIIYSGQGTKSEDIYSEHTMIVNANKKNHITE